MRPFASILFRGDCFKYSHQYPIVGIIKILLFGILLFGRLMFEQTLRSIVAEGTQDPQGSAPCLCLLLCVGTCRLCLSSSMRFGSASSGRKRGSLGCQAVLCCAIGVTYRISCMPTTPCSVAAWRREWSQNDSRVADSLSVQCGGWWVSRRGRRWLRPRWQTSRARTAYGAR